MLRRILARLQGLILDRPVQVVVVSLVLLAVSAVLALGVDFRTSRAELAPADDPEQIKLDELVRRAGGDRALIACVEAADPGGADPASLRRFADRLALELEASPQAGSVFHKIPLEWFLEHALYLAPAETLDDAVSGLEGLGEDLDALLEVRSIADFNHLIADGIEKELERTAGADADDEAAAERLASMLDGLRRLLADPEAVLAPLESRPPLVALAGARDALESEGYLATRDGSMLFVIVTATGSDDSLPVWRAFVGAMRGAASRVIAEMPGFTVAFTGEPAMTVEEMDTIRRDTLLTSVVAVVGVTLLTFLVFRWRAHALLVLAALVVGVTWALGWVAVLYGYLNVVTSSFIATLIGVGAAYGIHPVSEYELEGAHTRDPKETVRKTYHRMGAPVAVAALTTAAAFFSIRLMKFRGFAELGAVAGAGVLLCLAAALVTLPAILLVYGRWRHARDRRHRASPVDRIWVERLTARICRHPGVVVGAALLLTVALGWSARGIAFDTNLLEILPRNSESQAYFERMAIESDLAPAASVVTAKDLDELRALRERAAAEPAILRFESALQFLPENPTRSREAIDRLAALLDRLHLPESLDPVQSKALGESAARLEESLAAASEDAFGAGMASVAGSLEDARAAAEKIADLAAGAVHEDEARWNDAQDRLLAWGRLLLADLQRTAGTEEPTVDTMPEPVRGRFLTADGRLLAYLKPHDNVFDSEVLDEYVAASRRVAKSAFGFPIVFHRVAGQITSGFTNAVILGAVLVFVILLIDFRGLREAGLAMIPLLLGMVWMLGWMGVLGLSFNFANLIAVPLVIGVGIDNGVHVVHRLRLEGERGMSVVLRHTGRAILISSLTTMIGFGSLALASHRGLESLGLMLLLGVGSCLITSTVVLPNLLVVLGKAGR